MVQENVHDLVDVSKLHQEEVRQLIEWNNLARNSRFNKCSQGWSGFGKSCFGYHGYFALLAATGSVSSPSAHESWYLSRLGQATTEDGNDNPAVLVSGLATPAMAHITAKGVEKGTVVDIIDICETPLLVTQKSIPELTAEHDLRIQKLDVLNADALLKFAEPRGKYSGIVTDAFLTRFTDVQKHQVLANLSKILRPGFGSLITTWRIRDARTDEKDYGTEQDKKIFVKNVVNTAYGLGIPFTMDEVGATMDYASTMTSYGGQTEEEIREIMEKHFRHVSIESTWPYKVYDVTMRTYARIFASQPKC